jgi:hypothetical protein
MSVLLSPLFRSISPLAQCSSAPVLMYFYPQIETQGTKITYLEFFQHLFFETADCLAAPTNDNQVINIHINKQSCVPFTSCIQSMFQWTLPEIQPLQGGVQLDVPGSWGLS